MSEARLARRVFETSRNSPAVTFDDGNVRRTLPYHDYIEACWPYGEPDTITVRIGDWIVVLHGHNLEPLFGALEEQSLKSVKARPELALEVAREVDTYVTEITFLPPLSRSASNLPKQRAKKDQLFLNPKGLDV